MSCLYREKSAFSIQKKENNEAFEGKKGIGILLEKSSGFKLQFGNQIAKIAVFLLALVCAFTLKCDPSYAAKKQNVLMLMPQDYSFYLYDDTRASITSITFLDNLKDVPSDAWDVSEKQNGSVMAWTVMDGHSYDMYVAGKGGVWANDNSIYLFDGFSSVTSIDFNDCFYTDNVTNAYGMFNECYSLGSLDVSNWDTSNLTDAYAMFHNCFSLESIDAGDWDISNVTDTALMFYGCSALKNLDVSKWDTSSVEYMESMFAECASLESLDLSKWDTSNVTDMNHMFSYCSTLKSLDVSEWDISNVTDMSSMFSYCPLLEGLDISGWNFSDVANKDDMFKGCSEDVTNNNKKEESETLEEEKDENKEEAENDNKDDSLQVSTEITEEADTDISFNSDCIIDELGWVEDVSSTGENLKTFYDETGVQPYVYFKAYDASLTTDDEKEEYAVSWYDENIGNENTFLYIYFAEEDTNNDVGYMYCVDGDQIKSIMDEEAIDIFWNYVNQYWYDANLSTDEFLIDVFDSTAKAIMNGDNGSGAKKSTRAGQMQSENDETEVIAASTEKNDLNVLMPVDQTSPFNMDDSYRSAVSSITFLDTLEDVPSDAWDVSEKQDGSVMAWTVQNGDKYDMYVAGEGGVWANPDSSRLFYGFDGLTSVDFNDCFYTDNATLMFGMFYECSSLESLDLNGWDISNVTDMYAIFWNCFALKELDINKWDTSNLTNTFAIFGNCSSLQSLDLGSWDTSKVTNMGYMFGECTSLEILNVNDWDTSNVTDMSEMFYNCQALENLDLSGWDTSSLTDSEGMFEGCPANVIIGDSEELNTILNTRDSSNLYILTWHGEADISNELAQLLEEAGINAKILDLSSSYGVPDDADCLLIASPTTDLSADETEKVINYLSNGGDAILITDYLGIVLPNYYSILDYCGINLVDGIVMESDGNYYYQLPYYLVPDIDNTDVSSDMSGGASYVLMAGAQGIETTDNARDSLEMSNVLMTSSTSYSKADIEGLATYQRSMEDMEGPFCIGMLITENMEDAESKVAVFTSSALIDDTANEMVNGGNYTLFMNTVNWACE